MMMRKPCSRRIATSSAVALVAQGTPNSLQAARTRSRFSCTSGWLAWPRNPIVTDMSPGPAQMAPMPSSDAEMSRMFCTPSASSTMPISKILPQGPGARDRRGRSIPAGSGPVSGGDVSPEPTSSRQHLRHRLRRVPEVRRHRMRYLGVATPTSTTVGVTPFRRPRFHDRDRGGRHRQFLRSGSRPSPARRSGKPDPSTGQTGSVTAPIEDVLSKGRLVARCCPTVALATRARAVTATKYRAAATAIGCRGKCGQAAAHSGAGRCYSG